MRRSFSVPVRFVPTPCPRACEGGGRTSRGRGESACGHHLLPQSPPSGRCQPPHKCGGQGCKPSPSRVFAKTFSLRGKVLPVRKLAADEEAITYGRVANPPLRYICFVIPCRQVAEGRIKNSLGRNRHLPFRG